MCESNAYKSDFTANGRFVSRRPCPVSLSECVTVVAGVTYHRIILLHGLIVILLLVLG